LLSLSLFASVCKLVRIFKFSYSIITEGFNSVLFINQFPTVSVTNYHITSVLKHHKLGQAWRHVTVILVYGATKIGEFHSEGSLGKVNMRLYLKNKPKAKGLEIWLKW
jgi:hypothetical protein